MSELPERAGAEGSGRLDEATSRAVQAVLAHGEVEVTGRIMPASNMTFKGVVSLEGEAIECVYKPVSGERPLWDFPDGTLAGREVASAVVSDELGWGVVPPTVLGEGPLGGGMVQAWQHVDETQDPVDLVLAGSVPRGVHRVFDGLDGEGDEVALVHESTPELRRMALFDVVVNNADRKGGHVLPMADGHRYGVDHGLTFHVETKLRTVLWGWAGEPLTDAERDDLVRLVARLADEDDPLTARLAELVHVVERDALSRRCGRLLRSGRMPVPSGRGPAIPWPAF